VATAVLDGKEGITGVDLAGWEQEYGNERLRGVLTDATALSERAIAALAWLQSFNVELIQAPLSRRQRERELKKGREIALTVQVRQARRYTSTSNSSGTANYSHRFETRGHYKHYFETKANGEPSKTFERCHARDSSRIVVIDGKPCFRFWVQPFVKGPADKPFVPKIRVADSPDRI
jgi:hypothetical protein